MKKLLMSLAALGIWTFGLTWYLLVSRVPDSETREEWEKLSHGPLCYQVRGNDTRVWHPPLGEICRGEDAPDWPESGGMSIDALYPNEAIGAHREFIEVYSEPEGI